MRATRILISPIVLCVCKTWCLALWLEHKFCSSSEVLDLSNRMVNRMHVEELNNVQPIPGVFRVIK